MVAVVVVAVDMEGLVVHQVAQVNRVEEVGVALYHLASQGPVSHQELGLRA